MPPRIVLAPKSQTIGRETRFLLGHLTYPSRPHDRVARLCSHNFEDLRNRTAFSSKQPDFRGSREVYVHSENALVLSCGFSPGPIPRPLKCRRDADPIMRT